MENNKPWCELLGRKDDFQSIVRLLTEFDERTGRFRRFADPETHFMRRAIAASDPDLLRIFLRELGGFVYYVAVELANRAGYVATSWVHEDGIRAERETFSDDGSHPVHGITCLTDLFQTETGPHSTLDDMQLPPAGPLQDLMAESVERAAG